MFTLIGALGGGLIIGYEHWRKEESQKLAVDEMYRTGVPASIKLAQALVESNSGQSILAGRANNHFGIISACANADAHHSGNKKRRIDITFITEDARGDTAQQCTTAKKHQINDEQLGYAAHNCCVDIGKKT